MGQPLLTFQMADTVIVTEEPEPPETTADVEAAQAAASAQAASEAAVMAAVAADAVSSQAQVGAADQVASYQAELAECRVELANVTRRQEEFSAGQTGQAERMASLSDQLSTILSRLPPVEEPPANPTAEDQTDPEEAAAETPAQEPSPAQRRKPHRWI